MCEYIAYPGICIIKIRGLHSQADYYRSMLTPNGSYFCPNDTFKINFTVQKNDKMIGYPKRKITDLPEQLTV